MKTLLLAGLIVVAAGSVRAAEAWSYNIGSNYCVQLVADGRGGCAAVTMPDSTNEITHVIWLDPQGQPLFSTNIYHKDIPPTAIISLDKKQLVFSFPNPASTNYLLAKVTKDGVAVISTDPTGYYILPSILPTKEFVGLVNVWQDKKGFFVQKVDTVAATVYIVRFTNK